MNVLFRSRNDTRNKYPFFEHLRHLRFVWAVRVHLRHGECSQGHSAKEQSPQAGDFLLSNKSNSKFGCFVTLVPQSQLVIVTDVGS